MCSGLVFGLLLLFHFVSSQSSLISSLSHVVFLRLMSSFLSHVVSSLSHSSLSGHASSLHLLPLPWNPDVPARYCCRSDSRHSGKCGMLQWAHSQRKRETERVYVSMYVSWTVDVSLFLCVKERAWEITERSGITASRQRSALMSDCRQGYA